MQGLWRKPAPLKKTSRTREVTTCQNGWEADKHVVSSYKRTYKRRQTHHFCSCIDRPLKAPPLTLFHYKRTRPVVNNCIPTPFLAFQPWPVERHSYLPDPSLGICACVGACAYISRRVWAPDYHINRSSYAYGQRLLVQKAYQTFYTPTKTGKAKFCQFSAPAAGISASKET